MKKQIGFYFLIFSFLATMIGCVSPAVKSRWVNPNTDKTQQTICWPSATANDTREKKSNGVKPANTKPMEGIAYSLPMVQFHLTAILTNVPNADASPVTVVTSSISSSYTNTTYINQTNVNAIYYITNVDKKIYTNANYLITNITVQVVSNSIVMPGVDTNTLKKAYVVTIDPIIAPDPDHLYALKMAEAKVSSDTFGLTVDPTNNFLQSVNSTNVDQTVNIIASLAQAAASIYTMGAGGIPTPSGPLIMTASDKTNWPGRIEVYFDPTTIDGSNGITAANQTISNQFANAKWPSSPISLQATFMGRPVSFITSNYLYAQQPQMAKGVLYRPMQTYILEIHNNQGPMGADSVQYLLRTPNAAPVFSLPVNRATFVTRMTSINFNNGFLQGVNYNNPSQVAAVLELPLTVVGDVFSSITNVLQLKLNIATAQSGIATQQTSLVNQMAALNYASSNLLNSATQLNAFKNSLTNKP